MIRRILLLPVILTWGQVAIGQAVPEFRPSPLRPELEASTVRANSHDNFQDLPPHIIYHHIFHKVLISSTEAMKFRRSDWEMIWELPSHQDVRFLSYAHTQMEDACNDIAAIPGERQEGIYHKAVRIEAAKSAMNTQLDVHYENFVRSLSREDLPRAMQQGAVKMFDFGNRQ